MLAAVTLLLVWCCSVGDAFITPGASHHHHHRGRTATATATIDMATNPVAVFTTNALRVTDHPCLLHCKAAHPDTTPVLVLYTPRSATADEAAAVACLQRSLGPALHRVDSEPALAAFLHAQRQRDDATEVVYCPSGVEPHASAVRSLETVLRAGDCCGTTNKDTDTGAPDSLGALRCVPVADELFPYPDLAASSPYDLAYEPAQYADEAAVPVPSLWCPSAPSPAPTDSAAAGGAVGGEARALSLLVEYLTLGEDAFTARHAATYAARFPTTRSHQRSIQRLLPGYLSRATADLEKAPSASGSVLSGADAAQVPLANHY